MRFLYLIILCLILFPSKSQTFKEGISDLAFKPGIYGQLNLVDSKAYNFGVNLFATHGLLANSKFVLYGLHIGLNKFNTDSLSDLGLSLVYQRNSTIVFQLV
jgi:hypothetical protein